ncbi:MAG: hypothetical protein MAGBODY4_00920 [Candidatus Marinimicrobia bacterium]|nr:hypothetical protein [Candidatus Neomarinimicrobiota bacterium]
MPMYEYRCRNCGATFDELVISAQEEVQCPECDEYTTEKLMSAFASGGSSGSSYAGASGGGCGTSGFT